jgi:hypothetical protein
MLQKSGLDSWIAGIRCYLLQTKKRTKIEKCNYQLMTIIHANDCISPLVL